MHNLEVGIWTRATFKRQVTLERSRASSHPRGVHSNWDLSSAALAHGTLHPVERREHFRSWNNIQGFEITLGSPKTLDDQKDQEERGSRGGWVKTAEVWKKADSLFHPFAHTGPGYSLPFTPVSLNSFSLWGGEGGSWRGKTTRRNEEKTVTDYPAPLLPLLLVN